MNKESENEVIGMMGYGGYRYGMMGHGGGWIMMLAMLVITIAVVFLLVRFFQRTSRIGVYTAQSSALNILDERYAKGEITDEEYRMKKSELKR